MTDTNTTEAIVVNETTDNTALAILGQKTVTDIVAAVKNSVCMKQDDYNFLMEHAPHLGAVMEKTFMWRTDFQKMSIINDINHPTNHSKFHQAILEQKVQFDQTLYLAKEYEDKKLEVEELECDLEELELNTEMSEKRKDIKRRKIERDIQFAEYQLNNMQISMNYRMAEVKGWQVLEEDLINRMHAEGLTDDEIWQRDFNEVEELFFRSMNNLRGIAKSTDGGEYNNLIIVARYAYVQARDAGLLPSFQKKPAWTAIVQDSVLFIEGVLQSQEEASAAQQAAYNSQFNQQ